MVLRLFSTSIAVWAGVAAVAALAAVPAALAQGTPKPATETTKAANKAVQDYLRTSRVLSVKSAVYGDRRLAPEELRVLAELPPKPQLQARLVGTIQGPMSSLVGTINGLLSQLAYVVDQRAQQLGGAAATPSEATP